MSDTIFLRVGTENRITLKDFVDSLANFLSVLKNLDSAVSRRMYGSADWEVVRLEKNSAPLVGVQPFTRQGAEDVSFVVENQLIENAHLLTKSERTEFMSDKALYSFGKLAEKTKKLGPMEVFINGTGTIKAKADISENTFQGIQQLTTAKYYDFGTIQGSLDSISVHRAHEFRIWNDENKKSVLCRFNESDLEKVKLLLKSRVMVTGNIESNAAGIPIAISVEDLEPAATIEVPTIDEMTGLVPNITEGLSLKEYMERLSNE